MNWYIGQEIVCIKTHSKGMVTKGRVYTIDALSIGCCVTIISVGIPSLAAGYRCSSCGALTLKADSKYWFSELLFAPLEFNQEAIDELMELPQILINKK
jgi:hypothetical protein